MFELNKLGKKVELCASFTIIQSQYKWLSIASKIDYEGLVPWNSRVMSACRIYAGV